MDTIVGMKAERLVSSMEPTPQEVNEMQMLIARNAMSAFYVDTFREDETCIEVVDDEEPTKDQDSINIDKRENPKVGRGLKPTRKGHTQET